MWQKSTRKAQEEEFISAACVSHVVTVQSACRCVPLRKSPTPLPKPLHPIDPRPSPSIVPFKACHSQSSASKHGFLPMVHRESLRTNDSSKCVQLSFSVFMSSSVVCTLFCGVYVVVSCVHSVDVLAGCAVSIVFLCLAVSGAHCQAVIIYKAKRFPPPISYLLGRLVGCILHADKSSGQY